METLILLMVFRVFLVSGEVCACEERKELEIRCGGEFMLLTAIRSKEQFFRAPVGAECRRVGKEMLSEEKEVHRFVSVDSGMTVNAACPHEHPVVEKMKFCMEDEHVTAITLHCKKLKDPEWIIGPYEATSDKTHHTYARCDKDGFINSLDMTDSGDGVVTRVTLGCLEVLPDALSLTADS